MTEQTKKNPSIKKKIAKKTAKKRAVIKNKLGIFAAVVAVFLIILSVSYNDSAPGGILYGIDRGIEKIALNATKNPEKIIDLRIKHATERLEEAKLTSRDASATQILMNEFSIDLDVIAQELSTMVDSEEYSDEVVIEIIKDLVDIYTVSFGRTINVRTQSTSVKSVQHELNKSIRSINEFIFDIFDLSINNLEGNYEYDLFVLKMLGIKVRELAQEVRYMEEDTAAVSPQLSEEDLAELTATVEDIRTRFFEVRDQVGSMDNLELYNTLQTIDSDLSDTFSPMLVQMSQKGLGIDIEKPVEIEETETEVINSEN